MPTDLRTRAIVLRRTNYGEADRILNLLTPEGKIAVLARGVRKEKSRLAGSIELFSVSDVVIHQGHSSLGTLTSAKMLNFYGNILSDMTRLELAASFLKKLDRAAEPADIPEYFGLLEQVLSGLHQNLPLELVQTWFSLNLARASGEEINLIYDINGDKLELEGRYNWDITEKCLKPDITGRICAKEIKLTRFLISNKLCLAVNIENLDQVLPAIIPLAQSLQH